MTLYLTGPTAIEYWRRFQPPARKRTRIALPFGLKSASTGSEFKLGDLAALDGAGLAGLSEPIHLLVSDASFRRRSDRVTFHVCSQTLPENSFVKASRDVLVSAPELACITSASSTSFPLFVELLYELCGYYRLPWGRAGACVEMPPATSVSCLRAFAERVRGMRGAEMLKRAVRYACDNSLSPMETDIAEAMVLDPRMGGFGIAKPQLNPRFEVARKNRRMLPQSSYMPDLYWPQACLSVEYDSDKHHNGDRRIAEDAIRRNGIEHLGTRVITMTWGQANDYCEFERIALMVSHALGKRFGPGWNKWAKKRRELHQLLVRRRVG